MKTETMAVRVEESVQHRFEVLTERLRAISPMSADLRVSNVMRTALLLGLQELEQKHGGAP